MAQLIVPGNAQASEVYAGKKFSAGVLYDTLGTMPVSSGVVAPAGTSLWGNGDLAVYVTPGYYSGTPGGNEIRVTTAQLQSAASNLVSSKIKYGEDIFGVVGAYTRPGEVWTPRANDSANWVGIAFGKGVYVAVGNGAVCTSIDGVNWTVGTAQIGAWTCVKFANNMFVAMASTGLTPSQIMTSPDGFVWTQRNSPGGSYSWADLAYGNGVWCAVASTGSGTTIRNMYSTDGINWNLGNMTVPHRGICFGKGFFVAVNETTVGARISTSTDGINWTPRSTPLDNNWTSICFGNNMFVATAYTGTGTRVMTSPDAINWTLRTYPVDLAWMRVIYGCGMFVTLSTNGTTNKMMSSPDGITWTSRVTNTCVWYDACSGFESMIVAVGGSGTNHVMTSTFS